MNRNAAVLFGLVFAVLGTLFTLFPELLAHSPVGFEKRGIVHHVWHYVILIGSFALLAGLWVRDRLLEAVGLVALAAAIALNLTAILTAGDEAITSTFNSGVSGMDVALRVLAISAVAVRLAELRKDGR